MQCIRFDFPDVKKKVVLRKNNFLPSERNFLACVLLTIPSLYQEWLIALGTRNRDTILVATRIYW